MSLKWGKGHDSFFAWHDSFICVICFIESYPSNGWMLSYVLKWVKEHDSFICVTWLIYLCDMLHPFEGRDSPIWGTWLTHLRDVTQYNVGPCCRSGMCAIWLTHVCVTWLIHVCGMAHSCVWHGSFMCVAWLDYMCDMTHSCVTHLCCDMTNSSDLHDSVTCVTRPLHMCGITLSYAWHDSCLCATYLCHLWDMTQCNVRPWCGAFMCDVTHLHL